jgi:F420-0:gamma-glutamyl ligase
MLAYFFADAPERIGKIIKLRMHHQINLGISTTRGSDKNCFKYGFTAAAVGASGVPKLTNRTAVRKA